MIAVPPERKDNRYFALKCARIGLHVFPCRTDKRPISRLRWRDISTTDVATIDRWWGKWPDALPAIDLGKSGLIVIDADRHEGGPDGVAAFVQLCADHQTNLADVPTVVTPSGGRHFYFKQRDGEPLGNGRGTLPLGVDVRGDGGYVIAPGAQLPDGGRYAWDDGTPNVFTTLRNGLAPVLPQAAEQIIARTNGYDQDSEHPAQKAKLNGGTGKSTTIRERAWAQAALVGCVKDLASKPSVPCGRNNLLNALAFRMGTMVARRWIERSTVEAKLFDAAVKCALVKDDGARTVRATIKSGLDNGEKEPHPDLKDRPHEKPSTQARQSMDKKEAPQATVTAAPVFSDEYLALRFAEQHEHDLRYVATTWVRWLTWKKTHWQLDDTLTAFSLARALCREVAIEAEKPGIQKTLASAKTVAAVERLAKADRRLAATVDQWDHDADLFNTPETAT